MDQIRFTNLHNQTPSFSQAFVAGMEVEASPTNPTAQLGADEFVLDSSRGTFASLQEPLSFSSMMNDGNRSYSFVM